MPSAIVGRVERKKANPHNNPVNPQWSNMRLRRMPATLPRQYEGIALAERHVVGER